MKKLTPLRKSGGILYSNRLQADGLVTFLYFGVKLFIAYHMLTDTLNPSAGRRFEQFSYFGVKLIVVCHMVHGMLKTPAGRRFEYIVHTLG